jgi:hypothetical protein
MKMIYNSKFTMTMLAGLLLAIAASPAPALPPDPDNAALLYYQGFLSMPELSEEAIDRIANVARGGTKPDNLVREDIGKCDGAIHFAEAGASVPACQWGVQFSQGFDALMPQLAQMRLMSFILAADAQILAADGDYKAAFERCLIIDKFARHVGDDTLISYLVSIAVRGFEYKCIQDIAGQAADDVELLQWLKNELAISPANTLSPARPMKFEIEITTDLMQMENIEKFAGVLGESNENKAAEIARKADAKILKKARQIYTERMNSAIRVWNTPMPYEQAHSQLKKLENDFDSNDPASAAAKAFLPTIARILTLKTRSEAHANAIKAGVEILLDRAKRGRLADTLPAGLPKDTFSGKDFEYEKTKDGFILRCPGKDLDKDEINQYEFKLSK